MFKNFGLPTTEQWAKVLKAYGYAFASTFLATFMAGGGIQTEYQATVTLAASALVAAINAGLYALQITFFEPPKK